MLEPAPGLPVETTLVEASRQNHPTPAQVDDLTDIGNLEGYVDRSAVVLMLLSRGYLTSRNCLREVVATVRKKKPYLFVHEADVKKGGAPLINLKCELTNDTLRQRLFDGRPATVWHRVADLQKVSLHNIVHGMLRYSPKYAATSEPLELYMPDSLLEWKFAFPRPVLLYASRNNKGADVAARELCFRLEELKGASNHWLGSE